MTATILTRTAKGSKLTIAELDSNLVNLQAEDNFKESSANKDASGGYSGLTLFKINFKNAANTFTSFFTNSNSAARTYTFQDRDGTIADNTDLLAKESSANKDASGGYSGLTLFKINFKNAANTFTSFFTNSNSAARTYTFQDRDLTVAGTDDITGNLLAGNLTTISASDSTTATSTTSASMKTAGGLGVVKKAYFGEAINQTPIIATSVEGDVFIESGQAKPASFSNGILGWYDKSIYSGTADRLLSGIVTSQSLFPATFKGTRTLPANWWKVGKSLRFRVAGYYNTDAGPGSATLLLKFGTTTYRTTGSFSLDASVTNGFWQLEGAITCYSTGVSGTLQGSLTWLHAESAGGGILPLHSQPFTSVAPVTYDTTTAGAFDVEWTATDAGTSITATSHRLWEVC